eukprot:12582781-Alexandrium_andersonii.AAC.1
MGIQATQISAWRAANQQEWLARGDESDRALAVAREIRVPRLASRARAQAQGPCREDPIPGLTFGHC